MIKEVDILVTELSNMKASDILLVSFDEGHHLTDQLIIASASNAIHLKSLMDATVRLYKNQKKEALEALDFFGVSGQPESMWVILDFNQIIVHIMGEELREQYDFDNLFAGNQNYRYH